MPPSSATARALLACQAVARTNSNAEAAPWKRRATVVGSQKILGIPQPRQHGVDGGPVSSATRPGARRRRRHLLEPAPSKTQGTSLPPSAGKHAPRRQARAASSTLRFAGAAGARARRPRGAPGCITGLDLIARTSALGCTARSARDPAQEARRGSAPAQPAWRVVGKMYRRMSCIQRQPPVIDGRSWSRPRRAVPPAWVLR